MIEQIAKEITQQHEMTLESILSKLGFDKDYILQHSDEFYCIDAGNEKIYFHNDIEIFREVLIFDYENNKIITKFIVR